MKRGDFRQGGDIAHIAVVNQHLGQSSQAGQWRDIHQRRVVFKGIIMKFARCLHSVEHQICRDAGVELGHFLSNFTL